MVCVAKKLFGCGLLLLVSCSISQPNSLPMSSSTSTQTTQTTPTKPVPQSLLSIVQNNFENPIVRDLLLPPGSYYLGDLLERYALRLVFDKEFGYLPSLYASGSTCGGHQAESSLIVNFLTDYDTEQNEWRVIHNFLSPQDSASFYQNERWVNEQIEKAQEDVVQKIIIPFNWQNHAAIITVDASGFSANIKYYDSSNYKRVTEFQKGHPKDQTLWSEGDLNEAYFAFSLQEMIKKFAGGKNLIFENYGRHPQKGNGYCLLYQVSWVQDILKEDLKQRTGQQMEALRQQIQTGLLKRPHVSMAQEAPDPFFGRSVSANDKSIKSAFVPEDQAQRALIWNNILAAQYRSLRGLKEFSKMTNAEARSESRQNLSLSLLGTQRTLLWKLQRFDPPTPKAGSPTSVSMADILIFGDPQDMPRLTEIIKPAFFKQYAEFTDQDIDALEHYKAYIKTRIAVLDPFVTGKTLAPAFLSQLPTIDKIFPEP